MSYHVEPISIAGHQIPEGYERCPIMDATATCDRAGNIRPWKPQDSFAAGYRLVQIAHAIGILDEICVRRTP